MRVAARRGSIVEHSTLVGYSILVVEQEPFVRALCPRAPAKEVLHGKS